MREWCRMKTIVKILLSMVLLSVFGYTSEVSKSDENATVSPVVVLETNVGNIELRLFEKAAPLAVENFVTHVKNGYYDGIIFHRVIKGFMIQGGDPTGTGMGGESIWKKEFKNEYAPNLIFNRPFLLAMANRGPDTNGSQFFITVAPAPWLNGGYTIFGEVIKGQEIVQKIENVTVSPGNDRPIFDQVIKKAYLR